ncbi:MAG: putative bifunctional diguanylate cyclase/phosphodiesterase [Janthinobacterium lividum]
MASLLWLAHPLFTSNFVQLILPIEVVAGCWWNGYHSRDIRDRRAWTLLTIAFGLWTIAEVCYLFEAHFLPRGSAFSSLDDVLWLLFAVPLLLVLSGSLEGKLNWVSWMDQIQAFVFFVVVALLVYSRPPVLSFDTAYSIQNVALLLSCLLRYSAAETHHEKTFFGKLAVYLAAYFLCAGIGNELAHRGWAPGSIVDLFWTLPLTLFCMVVLTGQTDNRSDARELPAGDNITKYLHDLCALGLAGLSMGSSVYLALHWTLPGSVCLACSFTLFAIRTCARERELHQANKRLHASVLEDALTGLGNRACLRQHLNHLLSISNSVRTAHHTVAVLFVDLDRFKAINDGLGHEVGDKVLVEVAARIRAACPGGAVACRLGGDEFVVVLDGELAENAERVATTILAEIRTPLWLGSKVLQLSGSIGVAVARGEDEPDDLLRKADQAMYRAKRLGKNRVEICDASLLSSLHTGYVLEVELRECLEREQIGVYLQPIYSLQNNDVCGFEALARWSHSQLGMVPPSDFIPLAEETGMILELGRQVLTRACREVALWNTTWNTHLSVSVNVSARQFSDPDLLPSMLQILASAGMDPRLLHLEITESVLLVGEDTVAKVLTEAQRQGMEISLDDFGTGYSSLSHLLSFPTDEIKIDRSFVRGLHRDARRAELVRTVLHLGRSLKKRVVAEGVETQEELQALQDMGCKYVQGYLFSEPFPAEALADQPLCAAMNRSILIPNRTCRVV